MGERGEPVLGDLVELRERRRRLVGDTAPGDAEDALRRVERVEVPSERPVLRDQAAREHRRERACADRDAERDQAGETGPVPQPRPRETDRIEDSTQNR